MTEPAGSVDRGDVVTQRVVDVAALERWLQARPPTTVLALSDRLLIASVVPRAEGPELARRFAGDVLAVAQGPEASRHLTTLCVLCATMEELGVDVDGLRFALALVARAVGVPEREPFRSTGRYWLWRAGLARSFDVDVDRGPPGPQPDGARWFDFAFFSHGVLFQTAYGRRSIDVDAARAAGFDDAVATVDVADGDSVALLLLCALGITPATRPDVAHLWARLAELQHHDGGFVTRVDDDVARHHAACVARLALALRDERDQR